jgi:hypothetical protein
MSGAKPVHVFGNHRKFFSRRRQREEQAVACGGWRFEPGKTQLLGHDTPPAKPWNKPRTFYTVKPDHDPG